METRSAMPSQTSPFFPIAAVLDLRFTTVDIAASLPALGVVLDCMPRNAVRRLTPSEALDAGSTASIARTTQSANGDGQNERGTRSRRRCGSRPRTWRRGSPLKVRQRREADATLPAGALRCEAGEGEPVEARVRATDPPCADDLRVGIIFEGWIVGADGRCALGRHTRDHDACVVRHRVLRRPPKALSVENLEPGPLDVVQRARICLHHEPGVRVLPLD